MHKQLWAFGVNAAELQDFGARQGKIQVYNAQHYGTFLGGKDQHVLIIS
jgi:hypothetical protein